ncbi:MAG TPA: hypothetical protein PLL88_02375 [Anaerolineaceae bacterium]|jgi:hypothetical protein|nr:hypothetical protein [Anaerolineaceae bacterium]
MRPTRGYYRGLPQEPQKLFSGGLSAPHALQTTWERLFFFHFFFHGLEVSIVMALVFFAIQIKKISEKMINPIATIMEIITGLDNMVVILYSKFWLGGGTETPCAALQEKLTARTEVL